MDTRTTNTSLRSLVRPVSPLSRFNQPSAMPPLEVNGLPTGRRASAVGNHITRSRSRSPPPPLLASTVHMPNRDPSQQHQSVAMTTSGDGDEETRRVVCMRRFADEERGGDVHNPHRHTETAAFGSHARGGEVGMQRGFNRPNERAIRDREPRKVDRANTCPILVRLAYNTRGRHHSLTEFDKGRFPENELQINTWIDCSLRELADEIRDTCPEARRRGARLHFVVIYPDQRGTYRRRELGVVISGFASSQQQTTEELNSAAGDPEQGQRSFNLKDDSTLTLLSKRFHIGDYIDVAIIDHVPGTLGGWTAGRRPLGPTPVSSRVAANLI